jgi:hypothetical protein
MSEAPAAEKAGNCFLVDSPLGTLFWRFILQRWQGSILQVEPLFPIADSVVCCWDKEDSLPGWGPYGELANLHLRGGPACRTLWVNDRGKGSYETETILVKHGVLLERVSTLFGPAFPVSAMVLCVDQLETDLSSFKVLRNQKAQVFWEAIRLQLGHSGHTPDDGLKCGLNDPRETEISTGYKPDSHS